MGDLERSTLTALIHAPCVAPEHWYGIPSLVCARRRWCGREKPRWCQWNRCNVSDKRKSNVLQIKACMLDIGIACDCSDGRRPHSFLGSENGSDQPSSSAGPCFMNLQRAIGSCMQSCYTSHNQLHTCTGSSPVWFCTYTVELAGVPTCIVCPECVALAIRPSGYRSRFPPPTVA